MSGSEDTDSCSRFYRLMAEFEQQNRAVALHIVSTPDGRFRGTPETLLKFPYSINDLLFEVRTQLAQKKIGFVEGMSAAPGIEGSRCSGPVSTSSNHPDNEPTVTSNDNCPGGLFRNRPKHWDGTPDVVLSFAAPRIQGCIAEVKNQNGSLSNRP